MDESSVIALFPLHTVLFPGGPLPLRIFETRYTDMVRRCMREQQPFGVVLIQEGDEAGDVATTATVGCTARIADFHTLHDGLLGISCVGERKFRVLRVWRASDGLNMGEVSWLPADRELALPERYAHLARHGAARARRPRRTLRTRREEIRRRRLDWRAAHRAPAHRACRQAGVARARRSDRAARYAAGGRARAGMTQGSHGNGPLRPVPVPESQHHADTSVQASTIQPTKPSASLSIQRSGLSISRFEVSFTT